MSNNEMIQAELLEDYCRELKRDQIAAAPSALEPELAATARLLSSQLHPPLPDDAYALQLQARLAAMFSPAHSDSEVIAKPSLHRAVTLKRWSPLIWSGIVVAAVLVISITAILPSSPVSPMPSTVVLGSPASPTPAVESVLRRPDSNALSAAEIISRTQQALSSNRLSLVAMIKWRYDPRYYPSTPSGEKQIWYQAPYNWRMEDGDKREVGNSQGVWQYNPSGLFEYPFGPSYVYYLARDTSDPHQNEAILPGMLDKAGRLNIALVQAEGINSTLEGYMVVAGRDSYVVSWDSTVGGGSEAYKWDAPATEKVWIDRETYLPLKWAWYMKRDASQPLISYELDQLEYKVAILPSQFVFTMPQTPIPGNPTPGRGVITADFSSEIRQLAGYTSFAIYLPHLKGWQLGTLAIGAPGINGETPGAHLELRYHQASNSFLNVTEGKVTPEAITEQTKGLESQNIAGSQVWTTVASTSRLVTVRGSTLISIAVSRMDSAGLTDLADSLAPMIP